MKYFVEPIGAQFKDKDLPALAAKFSERSRAGWQLHSVFQVSQPVGCVGGQSTTTYLAIYESES